ncbi:MAG TPA: hypothetical protein QGF02_04345 [Candidatus Babeliales bacterium]|nr:hypothetical protein [Candidatus Babeliales bacterium]
MTKKTYIYVITMLSVLSLCGGRSKAHGQKPGVLRKGLETFVPIKSSPKSRRNGSPSLSRSASSNSERSPLAGTPPPPHSPSLVSGQILRKLNLDGLSTREASTLLAMLNESAWGSLSEDSLD